MLILMYFKCILNYLHSVQWKKKLKWKHFDCTINLSKIILLRQPDGTRINFSLLDTAPPHLWIIIIFHYSTSVISKHICFFQKSCKSPFETEQNILGVPAAMLSLGSSHTVAAATGAPEAKLCCCLWAGTSGHRGGVASCWEPWERWAGSSGLGSGLSSPPWFLRAKARRERRALPKSPWCCSCCRIHLDRPGGKQRVQNQSFCSSCSTALNSTWECKYFCVGRVSRIARICSQNHRAGNLIYSMAVFW